MTYDILTGYAWLILALGASAFGFFAGIAILIETIKK